VSSWEKQMSKTDTLAVDKIGDSLIQSDMKLGPQTHFDAKSQSEKTIQKEGPNGFSVIYPSP